MLIWNPWHGCHKISEGCDHCYMYFLDSKRGVDTSVVTKTANFNLPVQRDRKGNLKLKSGMQIYVCLSTDFFVEEADAWRPEIWKMIRQRSDIAFRILTKRAHRIKECLPDDWGEGYPNVMLSMTCENQRRADERLPILLSIPAQHKGFMAAPFIGEIDATKYLTSGQIEEVLCGGENYDGARVCRYEWVESLAKQCIENEVTFNFIETGTVFEKDGKTYRIPSKRVQSTQAYKSGLSKSFGKPKFELKHPSGTLFEAEPYTPYFREHCSTCGSRLTCNGCSNCGNCNFA